MNLKFEFPCNPWRKLNLNFSIVQYNICATLQESSNVLNHLQKIKRKLTLKIIIFFDDFVKKYCSYVISCVLIDSFEFVRVVIEKKNYFGVFCLSLAYHVWREFGWKKITEVFSGVKLKFFVSESFRISIFNCWKVLNLRILEILITRNQCRGFELFEILPSSLKIFIICLEMNWIIW